MKELTEINEMEAEHLVWIHSNKFTTPELFYKKFLSDKTSRTAYNFLNRYASPERHLLHTLRTPVANTNFFYLTAGALRILDENKQILVRSTRYPVKVNPREREHDIKVQLLRIAFEASPDLLNVFWVSDFEMRSGITPTIKAEYLNGKLDVQRWRLNGANPNSKGHRTPDAYFEADLGDRRIAFALEFENQHYSEDVLMRMVWNLRDGFPNALKLIVAATAQGAVRLIRLLKHRIKDEEQHQWFVSDLEKVISMSFKSCWHPLDRPLAG